MIRAGIELNSCMTSTQALSLVGDVQGAAIKRPHYKNCNIFETAQEF